MILASDTCASLNPVSFSSGIMSLFISQGYGNIQNSHRNNYVTPTKVKESNVFTGVCLSTGGISGPMSFQECGWVDISGPMSLPGVCPGGGYVRGGEYVPGVGTHPRAGIQ